MNSATAQRPPVPHEAPAGFRWAGEQAPAEWQPADPGRTCRAYGGAGVAHGAPAAVKNLHGITRRVWWQLCLQHGAGHWIENGKVMQWVLREDPDWEPPES